MEAIATVERYCEEGFEVDLDTESTDTRLWEFALTDRDRVREMEVLEGIYVKGQLYHPALVHSHYCAAFPAEKMWPDHDHSGAAVRKPRL